MITMIAEGGVGFEVKWYTITKRGAHEASHTLYACCEGVKKRIARDTSLSLLVDLRTHLTDLLVASEVSASAPVTQRYTSMKGDTWVVYCAFSASSEVTIEEVIFCGPFAESRAEAWARTANETDLPVANHEDE